MLTTELIIAQARALSPAPIGRLNYHEIAALIHPETGKPRWHEWSADEKAALLAADLPEVSAYTATCRAHPGTADWADMVAMCVTLWQMWAAQQRWLDARRQEQADVPMHL
jgi:hypothetical protein